MICVTEARVWRPISVGRMVVCKESVELTRESCVNKWMLQKSADDAGGAIV